MSKTNILENPLFANDIEKALTVFNPRTQEPDLITHNAQGLFKAAEYFERIGVLTNETWREIYDNTISAVLEALKKLEDRSSITAQELLILLGTATQYWYDVLVSSSLDAIYRYCFNDHSSTHIYHTTRRALELLLEADGSEQEELMVVVAAELHDMANVFNRGVHSLIVALWFRYLVSSMQLSPEMQDTITEAMAVHDDEIANALIQHLVDSGVNENEVIQYMREDFGKVALSLIIADKTEIGHFRTSPKLRKDALADVIQSALENDRHLTVNLFGRFTKLVFKGQKREILQMDMEFNLKHIDELRNSVGERFLAITQASQEEQRLMVPNRMKTFRREHNQRVNYFTSWMYELGDLYRERLQLLVRSAFALYPQLEQFQFRFYDPEWQQTKIFVVTKENLRATFAYNPFFINPATDRGGAFQVYMIQSESREKETAQE